MRRRFCKSFAMVTVTDVSMLLNLSIRQHTFLYNRSKRGINFPRRSLSIFCFFSESIKFMLSFEFSTQWVCMTRLTNGELLLGWSQIDVKWFWMVANFQKRCFFHGLVISVIYLDFSVVSIYLLNFSIVDITNKKN